MEEPQYVSTGPGRQAGQGRLRFALVLGAVLLVAFGLRIGVSFRTIWYDEACTYWESKGSPLAMKQISFSPIPAWTVAALPGNWDEPWVLRLPFVLLGVASIAAFAAAMKLRDGPVAGLLTAAVLAVSPYHVLYSTEARMYAWVQVAAGVCFLCFVLLLKRQRWWLWVGYAAAGILGTSAHLFFATLVLAQGGYLLVTRRQMFRRWFAVAVVMASGSLPALWYGVTVHGVSKTGLGWIHARPLLAIPATFYGFALGNAFVPAVAWWLLAGCTVALTTALVLRALWPGRPWESLVVWSALAPPGLIIAASTVFNLYSEQSIRYLAFAQPFLLILLVRGTLRLAIYRRRIGAAAAVVLLLVVGNTPLAFLWERQGMGAHDLVAERLRALAGPGDVIVAEPLTGVPIAYYLRHDPGLPIVLNRRTSVPEGISGARRVLYVELENRTMTSYLRWRGRSRLAQPPQLPGFTPTGQELFAGRKPITLTILARADGSRAQQDETAGAGAGEVRGPDG